MSFAASLAAADRAALGLLGQPVSYAPRIGDPVNVTGIFDDPYARVDALGALVQSNSPTVTVRLADLPVDPEEDDPVVTVAAKSYRVREAQRDGTGMVTLLLREVA